MLRSLVLVEKQMLECLIVHNASQLMQRFFICLQETESHFRKIEIQAHPTSKASVVSVSTNDTPLTRN